MDAMKEALRRKIMELKGGGGPMAGALQGPAGEGEAEKDPELAPALEVEGAGVEGEAPIDEEQLMMILEALGDHSPGSGREPNGLQERAAVGAKAKLSAMQGMKK